MSSRQTHPFANSYKSRNRDNTRNVKTDSSTVISSIPTRGILFPWKGLEILEAGLDWKEEFERESLSSHDESDVLSPSVFLTNDSGLGPTGHCDSCAIPITSAVSRACFASGRGGRRGMKDGSGGVICLKKDFRGFSGDGRPSREGVEVPVTVRDLARTLGTDFA